jgi:hypothetical protein
MWRWNMEQFTVFDDVRVHVELLAAKMTVTAPGELDVYLRACARLTTLAVYGAEARALIVKAIDSLPWRQPCAKWSNSPDLAPVSMAAISERVKRRAGPLGALLCRMTTPSA